MFRPKIMDTLRGYDKAAFLKDTIAGIIVGVVALPLAIAFAIASGVSPEKGLFTAIIAGFIISAMGGSRVQIGGPTGAFIVVVYGIVQQYGIEGLVVSTLMAGVLLILMGVLKLGNVIMFIPYPLITGFTSGIALIIFSSQVKDFLGLDVSAVPAGFLDKWEVYAANIASVNPASVAIGLTTLTIILLWPRVSHKVPGSLIAILLTTAVTAIFNLPVATIGSVFGAIPSAFPAPVIPAFEVSAIGELLKPAITIALLGGIESLLSAVVADGMMGTRHRSNTELIAQGTANIFSSLFGGIPATGAIARTATNIRNGGRTPVAGMIHALVLLLILLFAGRWAALIPMATLAGILVIVAVNMSEARSFMSVMKGSKSDTAVMLVTFVITVMVDLTVAIEAGMVLAAFLFLRKMMKTTSVRQVRARVGDEDAELKEYDLPEGVEVFEIHGPVFFGAAYKFKDAFTTAGQPSEVLIIRMRYVPMIDATGIRTLKEIVSAMNRAGTRLILSEVRSEQVIKELKSTRLQFQIGKANITRTLDSAVERALALRLKALPTCL